MAESGKSYWIRSGIQTIFERFSVLIFNFGTLLILLRIYSLEEFGFWSLFLASTQAAEQAKNGLVQNGLIKFLATSKEDEESRIQTASLILNVILSLVFIALLIALAKPLSVVWKAPVIFNLFFIYIASYLVLIPMSHINFVQQGHLKFKGPMVAGFIRSGLLFVLVLILFLNGTVIPLEYLAGFQVLAIIGATLGTYYYGKEHLAFARDVDWAWVKKLFSYGKYVFGTNLSTMLYKNIDTFMLGYFINPIAVAMYRVCISINNFLEAPTQSIAQVVFPQGARKAKNGTKEDIKNLYENAVGGILALIIPGAIFLLLFPKFVLFIVGGDKYLDAVPLLSLTVIYALFFPFGNQFGTILDSIGKPKINFLFILFSAILNVILNIFFIQQYGLLGAAYGTLITYGTTFVLHQITLNYMFGVKFWRAIMKVPSFYILAFGIIRNYFNNKMSPQSDILTDTVEQNDQIKTDKLVK